MQKIMRKRAKELLSSKTVNRVLGWKEGEFFYDITPCVFHCAEEIDRGFVYNGFCSANLSKYLVAESQKEGTVAVFLKPCDSYSFNQLLSEHRISRDKVYIVGISCDGKIDIEKIRKKGLKGITGIQENEKELLISSIYGDKKLAKDEVLLERCDNCKSHKLMLFDELLGEDGELCESGRFALVEKLEEMTSEERFLFWQNELSRCIRCNACRNVCPACTCEKCVFDNDRSGIANKAPADSFEEKMFHIVRAFHVAGRCTDCGECSRVCPQNIPLHLLNRKFIKDINTFYGAYQAGAAADSLSPLVSYTKNDREPNGFEKKGE